MKRTFIILSEKYVGSPGWQGPSLSELNLIDFVKDYTKNDIIKNIIDDLKQPVFNTPDEAIDWYKIHSEKLQTAINEYNKIADKSFFKYPIVVSIPNTIYIMEKVTF